MIDLTINKTGLQHNIEKAKENHVIIPTIAPTSSPRRSRPSSPASACGTSTP